MFSRDKQLMAADGGLRRLFEKPVPENPTLLEALSAWNHRNVHPNKPIDPASFTEIFGELHFQEKQGVLPQPPPPEPEPAPRRPPRTASWLDVTADAEAEKSKDDSSLDALRRPKPATASAGVSTMKRSASFYTKKSSASLSLLLCTEGLGSESTVDADDMLKDGDAEAAARVEDMAAETTEDAERGGGAGAEEAEEEKRRRPPSFSFPPPIRSIGRGGRPSVCFRSFRKDGRFVLLEVVIPGKELLLATREGGRLRLQFASAGAAAAISGRVGGVDEELRGEDGDHYAKNAPCIDDDES